MSLFFNVFAMFILMLVYVGNFDFSSHKNVPKARILFFSLIMNSIFIWLLQTLSITETRLFLLVISSFFLIKLISNKSFFFSNSIGNYKNKEILLTIKINILFIIFLQSINIGCTQSFYIFIFFPVISLVITNNKKTPFQTSEKFTKRCEHIVGYFLGFSLIQQTCFFIEKL